MDTGDGEGKIVSVHVMKAYRGSLIIFNHGARERRGARQAISAC